MLVMVKPVLPGEEYLGSYDVHGTFLEPEPVDEVSPAEWFESLHLENPAHVVKAYSERCAESVLTCAFPNKYAPLPLKDLLCTLSFDAEDILRASRVVDLLVGSHYLQDDFKAQDAVIVPCEYSSSILKADLTGAMEKMIQDKFLVLNKCMSRIIFPNAVGPQVH
jgi:hypothetical protein